MEVNASDSAEGLKLVGGLRVDAREAAQAGGGGDGSAGGRRGLVGVVAGIEAIPADPAGEFEELAEMDDIDEIEADAFRLGMDDGSDVASAPEDLRGVGVQQRGVGNSVRRDGRAGGLQTIAVADGVRDLLAAFDSAGELVAQAEQEKKAAPLESKLKDVSKAMQEKKWDEALEDLAAAEKLVPENQRSDMAVNLDMNRFTILIRKKDYPAAYKLALKISDAHKDNAMVENLLAWQIITDKTIEKPDLDVAKTLADRANEAAKGKDGGIMDTQARVLFMKGQKEEAIAVETKAVAIADADMKQSLQSSLDSYKKGVLPDAE